MTANRTIDGVPRGLLERLLNAAEWQKLDFYRSDSPFKAEIASTVSELRALLDAPATWLCDTCKVEQPTERVCDVCGAQTKQAAQPQPDPVLCKFYDVCDWPGLVRELVGHVEQLQDSAKRNVKPWEDTFPPTLLPAYIERVNAENAKVLGQPAYRLLGDGDVIKDGDETLNDDTATWGKVPMGVFIGMPYNRRVMLPVRRVKP